MRRRQRELEDNRNPPWVATFCDMMLLMVSFFIILIAFSTFKVGRVVELVRGFQGSFSILPGGFKTDKGDQPIASSRDIVQTSRDPGTAFTGMKGSIEKSLDAAGLEKGVEVSVTKRGVVVNISDAILFDLGVADINPAAYPLLNKIGEIIKRSSPSIKIEGHTDNIPINTERFPSNWELSATRAVNVLRYFLNIKGVLSDRFSAIGYGEYRPLYSNDTPEHRAKNRRVVIVFSNNPSEDEGGG